MDETREQLLDARRKSQAGGGPWIPSEEDILAALQQRAHQVRVFYQMLQAEGFAAEEALELTGVLFPD